MLRIAQSLFLFALASGLASAAEPPPAELATEGRVFFVADASAGELSIQATGGAEIGRLNWMGPDERPRTGEIRFAINHYSWREIRVALKTERDGRIEVKLAGPWVGPDGQERRREVLWDDLAAEGAALANGGFEAGAATAADAAPLGWYRWGDGPAVSAEARAGERSARTWDRRVLSQPIAVRAGQPVTLTFHARAVLPEGASDMEPLPAGKTPAFAAMPRFQRGVNIGNWLEVPPGKGWDRPHSVEDIAQIAAAGFDHIRFPVSWHHYLGGEGGTDPAPELLGKVDAIARAALDRNLAVIVNWHHFDAFTDDPAAERARFLAAWEKLARHFRDFPAGLALEFLNEPKDAATTEAMNEIYAALIPRLRAIDAERLFFVGPGRYNSAAELPKLQLPPDERTVVTIHNYEPFFFTHQSEPWAGLGDLRGVAFPGPPDSPLALPEALRGNAGLAAQLEAYNSAPAAMNPCSPARLGELAAGLRAWQDHYGRPIHLGEFGANRQIAPASRLAYLRAARDAYEAAGIGWALWDWKAEFAYWDAANAAPLPGMREALGLPGE